MDKGLGTVTWTYRERGSSKLDYFPKVHGAFGFEGPVHMKVLKGFVFRGEKGDALRAWFQLYPGGSARRAGEVTRERGAPAWRAAGDRCIVDRVGALDLCRPKMPSYIIGLGSSRVGTS